MADPVSENVTQIQHSQWSEGLAVAKFVVANAFMIVGGSFAAIFMILIFTIFVKALKGSNLSDLFTGETKGQLSMTKFWTNVAYFSATLAFLAFNLLNQGSGESQVMVWLIYLGTVGANAIASKWLALKYAPAGTTVVSNDQSDLRYPPPLPLPPGPIAAPPPVTDPSVSSPSQPSPQNVSVVVSSSPQNGTGSPGQSTVTISTPTAG